MKWVADDTAKSGFKCEIVPDSPGIGYYLYIWKNGACVKDHLQDTLEIAMEQAQTDYGIARKLWRQISN